MTTATPSQIKYINNLRQDFPTRRDELQATTGEIADALLVRDSIRACDHLDDAPIEERHEAQDKWHADHKDEYLAIAEAIRDRDWAEWEWAATVDPTTLTKGEASALIDALQNADRPTISRFHGAKVATAAERGQARPAFQVQASGITWDDIDLSDTTPAVTSGATEEATALGEVIDAFDALREAEAVVEERSARATEAILRAKERGADIVQIARAAGINRNNVYKRLKTIPTPVTIVTRDMGELTGTSIEAILMTAYGPRAWATKHNDMNAPTWGMVTARTALDRNAAHVLDEIITVNGQYN